MNTDYRDSAAGKSHLALTLALTVQQSDMTADPGGAIILTTEREIASDRLLNLAIIMLEPHDDAHEAVPKKVKPYLDDIHSTKLKEIDHLINCITYVLPRMLEERNGVHRSVDNRQGPPRRPIRLLILDSITSLLRGDTTSPTNSLSLTERSRYICTIADQLKSLAAKYDLAVVVVNQVSDVFSRIPAPQSPVLIEPPSSSSGMLSQFYSSGVEEPPMLYSTQSRWFSGQSGSLKKEASLGIVWANAVNVRIMLSRTGRRRMLSERDIMIARKRAKVSFLNGNHPLLNDDELEHISDESTPTLIRRFHVVFSPFAPPSTTDYVISASGVHTLPNTTKVQDATSDVRSRARRAQAIRKMEREQNGDDGGDGGDDGVGNALDNDEVGRDVIAGVEGVVNEVNEDEFDNEIFDDLGDIPAEFWDGKLTEQGRAVSGE